MNDSTTSAKKSSRKKYKKDFLDQVLARVDFASSLSLNSTGPPKKVMSVLKNSFPILEHRIKEDQYIKVTPNHIKPQIDGAHEWLFFSKNRERIINITNDFMYLEFKKYESYEGLCKHFISVTDALFDSIDNLQIKRLGLRYIDKITIQDKKGPTQWEDYLDEKLLSCFSLTDNPNYISRAFNVLEFKYDDDMNLRFQYGMPNPDYPAAIKRKEFILDHDAYCTLLLEKNELQKKLDRFHDIIIESFESVITDILRKKMEIKNGK